MSAQSSTDDMEIDFTPVTLQGEWPNKRRKLDNFDSVQSSEPHNSTININQRYVTSLAPLWYIGASSSMSPTYPMVISSETFQGFRDELPDYEIETNPLLKTEVNSGSQQFEYSGLSAPETRLNITESTQDSEAGSWDPMQAFPQLENLRTELPEDVRPNWQRDPEFPKCLFIEWSAETIELFGNNIIKSVSMALFFKKKKKKNFFILFFILFLFLFLFLVLVISMPNWPPRSNGTVKYRVFAY